MLLCVIVMLSVAVTGLFTVHRDSLGHFVTFSSVSRTNCVVLTIMNGSTVDIATLACCMLVCMMTGLDIFTVVTSVRRRGGKAIRVSDCGNLCGAGPHLTFLVALTLFSLNNVPPFTNVFSGFFIFVTTMRKTSVRAALNN